MKVINKITIKELSEMAEKMFGELVKADVDVKNKIVVVDMPMHYEGEAYLLERGSQQQDIWGINLHPADFGTDEFIEFDSMINIRPSQNNPSKDVLNPKVRQKITSLIGEVVHE